MMTRLYLLLLGGMLLVGSCRDNPAEKPVPVNHLENERSPYLLQHANNPVDWYPWGDEALEKARRENKLLVISVGYTACHWCHVMEEESFMDTTVAKLMNRHFVSIKVDREERPDIDNVYMTACQRATGRGCGWPLNAFALPDGRPVWAGTYFPKKEWLRVLDYFIELWETQPEKLRLYAGELLLEMTDSIAPLDPEEQGSLSEAALKNQVRKLLNQADFQKGGSRGFPKFPMPLRYQFLMDWYFFSQDIRTRKAIISTLDQMAAGGIHDHLGGGFARYSTDPEWRIPHFEKMLYDNAQLVSLYADAYRLFGDTTYREVAYRTLLFMERELADPEGGFYASLDADSEGEEGTYYVWSATEIDSILKGTGLAELTKAYYGIRPEGNWEQGKNVLYLPASVRELARQFGWPEIEIREGVRQASQLLFMARSQRQPPALDDKILTSWNALALKAYLDAYAAFGETHLLERAREIALFIKGKMWQPDGNLNRNYQGGRSTTNAFLDDYALTIQAFIELYQASFEESWLLDARKLADHTLEHFSDDSTGLFYYTSDQDPPLVIRKREVEDNVIPASNSVLASSLWKLGHLFYDTLYLQRAEWMLRTAWKEVSDLEDPTFFSNWCTLYLDELYSCYEVVIVGPEAHAYRQQMQLEYRPNALYMGGVEAGTLPLLEGKWRAGGTWIYICQNKICKLPVNTVDAALAQF